MIEGICFGAMILTLWFLTDFKIYFFNSIYNKELDQSNIAEFIFLRFDKPIFGTKFTSAGLINCELCLSFWLAAGISIFIGPLNLPIIYVGQLILFGIIKKLV